MEDEPKGVTLITNVGEITFELYWKHAPNACKNFYELSKKGYYDNTIFHRVIKGLKQEQNENK